MEQNKEKNTYVSLNKLALFLENLLDKFSVLDHTHALDEIGLTIDSELSENSTNPVQNKVINEEFEAVATAMEVLESAIDKHTHAGYAASVENGDSAKSAAKLDNSLTLKLDNGNENGVSELVFDGQNEMVIEITSSAIGAATASHNHNDNYYTETEIDNMMSGKSLVQIVTWGDDD